MATVSDPVTDFCVGNPLALPRIATELPAPATSATIAVHLVRGDTGAPLFTYTINTVPQSFGQITQAGMLQLDGSYTALLYFQLSASDTLKLPPGVYSWATIEVLPGPYATEIIPLYPLQGGPHG